MPATRKSRKKFKLTGEVLTLLILTPPAVLTGLLPAAFLAAQLAWLLLLFSVAGPAFTLLLQFWPAARPGKPRPRMWLEGIMAAMIALAGAGIGWEALRRLAGQVHPTAGVLWIYHWPFWQGWLVAACLAGNAGWFFLLERLHAGKRGRDRACVLCRLGWMVNAAAAMGMAGVYQGWWWADALVAGVAALAALGAGVLQLVPRADFGQRLLGLVAKPERT